MAELKIVKKKKTWVEYDNERGFEIIKDRITSQSDKWWARIGSILKEGAAPHDKDKKEKEIRIKIHPVLDDMLDGFRGRHHFGWFKTKQDAARAIFNVGLIFGLSATEPKLGKATKFEKALASLEIMARAKRLGDFHDQIATFKQETLLNQTKDKKSSEVLEMVTMIEELAKDIIDEISMDNLSEKIYDEYE